MDLGLEGKVALVAASSKGLGKAIALGLAREGCQMVMCSRDEARIQFAAEEVREASGVRVEAIAADVTLESDLRNVAEQALARFGRVDVLVNNAGGPPPGGFDDVDDQAWQSGFELTLLSAVRLTRLLLPGMRERRWGRIVNVTSNTVKQPNANMLLSNSIRSAVTAMANTLAREVARDGVTVNNLAPGRIYTERTEQLDAFNAKRQGITVEQIRSAIDQQIPIGRYGRPDEFAAAAVFLASQQASYITGVTLLVDGGLVRSTY